MFQLLQVPILRIKKFGGGFEMTIFEVIQDRAICFFAGFRTPGGREQEIGNTFHRGDNYNRTVFVLFQAGYDDIRNAADAFSVSHRAAAEFHYGHGKILVYSKLCP